MCWTLSNYYVVSYFLKLAYLDLWDICWLLLNSNPPPRTPSQILSFMTCKFIAGTWPWDMWVQARHSFSAARPLTSRIVSVSDWKKSCPDHWFSSLLQLEAKEHFQLVKFAPASIQIHIVFQVLGRVFASGDVCWLKIHEISPSTINNLSNSPRLVFYHSRITLASHISAEVVDIQKPTSGMKGWDDWSLMMFSKAKWWKSDERCLGFFYIFLGPWGWYRIASRLAYCKWIMVNSYAGSSP